MMIRTCKKCLITKELELFYKNRHECRACVTKRTNRTRVENTYRRYKKTKCERCGFVAAHSCQLDVDHIDGNHFNNDIDNLQTLCANCHRLKTQLSREFRMPLRNK